MKTLKIILWTTAAVLGIILGLAWYGNSLKNNSAQTADKQAVVNGSAKPVEPVVTTTPAVKIEKTADLTMTPNELVKAEHKNKARFIRDIVGKTVKVTGKVKSINDGFFALEAKDSLSGVWTVYGMDSEFLANLNAGQVVTIVCEIEDVPLIGGASRCND